MKLISWNVNGLRACVGKGFFDFFKEEDADIFCLGETKMQPEQADFSFEGYYPYWNSAEKKGLPNISRCRWRMDWASTNTTTKGGY